jgi:methionyl-tRNA formyltransferase
LRVVFAGTPEFAVPALEAIVRAGHSVRLVLTQPDRPAGRGLRLKPSAVAASAQALGLEIAKPSTLRSAEALELVRLREPDVIVVAAYGLILPQALLDIPSHGCINIHASLLPRWRGAAPVQRAILAGDTTTGISIMQMEAGLDTGPVLLREEIEIGRDSAGTLTQRLAILGARAITDALARLGSLVPQAQDAARATYAAKVEKAEARIDWAASSTEVDRRIRAFNPFPGAEANIEGQALKIWEAEPLETPIGTPGSLLICDAQRVVVGCGVGSLQVKTVQRAGGRRIAAVDHMRGLPAVRTS